MLATLMNIELATSDFTSLPKRAAKLGVSLDIRKHVGPIDVVVDSTGLKVFGEGEWKMLKHGKSKRCTWRKLHLAVNPALSLLTGDAVFAGRPLLELLKNQGCDYLFQVKANQPD